MLNAITNFTKRFCSSKRAATLFVSITVLSILGSGCGERNLELGENLIPYRQVVTILIDSSVSAKTYIVGGDTLATNRCGAYYWGAKNDRLGVTRAEFAAQFMVATVADSLFGAGVSVDSLTLTLWVDSFLGNADTQSMTIYTLGRRLFADSVYYSNFDVAELKKDSLTEVELVAGRSEYTYKIYDASAVAGAHIAEFVESLADSSGGVYRDRKAFYRRFPGLFFGRKSGQSGAIYRFDAKKMKLSLYYKSQYAESDTSHRIDYTFADGTDSGNSGVSRIEFDYDSTDFGEQIGKFDTVSTLCVVQSLGGLKSMFEVDKQQLDKLRRDFIDEGCQSVAVIDARLEFVLEGDSVYKWAVSPMGLFREFRCYDSDYEYVGGAVTQQSVELNRTTGRYSVNLTSEVNAILSGSESRKIIMAPEPKTNLYSLSQMVLRGAVGEREPKLRLTIALIGKGDKLKNRLED